MLKKNYNIFSPADETATDIDEKTFFATIPLIPPTKIFDMLSSLGYKGQEKARKSICLMAYRHIKRLKLIHLKKIPRDKLPPKSNYLLIGPTGCGKTFIVELLFQKILKIPTVIVDVTGFSETGYVGNDPITILTRLLIVSNYNPIVASGGIICLDEFDKLATTQNTARFDGQGTTKDVSGFGVQKELLQIIDGKEAFVPLDFNNSIYSSKEKLNTEDIGFIACGAFSGLKNLIITQQGGKQIGFKTQLTSEKEKISVLFKESEINNIENFQQYGFLPELIGRFTRIVPLMPLDKDTLKDILIDNVVKKYVKEFEEENLKLVIENSVIDYIVDASIKRQTGARGLASVLTQYIEDASFKTFGTTSGTVKLKLKDNEVITEITK